MTSDRPAPPPLEFETPPCSVCGEGTEHDDGSFLCANCGASWSSVGESGEWEEPNAKQCSAQSQQPWDTYRCYRAAGHSGDHEHPDTSHWYEWEVPADA